MDSIFFHVTCCATGNDESNQVTTHEQEVEDPESVDQSDTMPASWHAHFVQLYTHLNRNTRFWGQPVYTTRCYIYTMQS